MAGNYVCICSHVIQKTISMLHDAFDEDEQLIPYLG